MPLSRSRLAALAVCVLLLSVPQSLSADLVQKWEFTATDGNRPEDRLDQGDAATLTWQIVADGNPIGRDGQSVDESSLVSRLDNLYGSGDGGADVRDRPWFGLVESAITRWSEVSGLTFRYETADDGARIGSGSPRGELGVRADIRIGGNRIDGNNGVLAYNFYPQNGDMVIDTADSFYENQTSNSLGLYNVVAHESGHGIGLDHRVSARSDFLMEPFFNRGFRGPQFDDIYHANRGYGDKYEKDGGNDTRATAIDLGSLNSASPSFAIGTDAGDMRVEVTDTDFVSIDGTSDVDYWSFTLSSLGFIDLILDPMGPTYSKRIQQDGLGEDDEVEFNASAQSDLILELFDIDGNRLAFLDDTGLGGSESLLGFELDAGTYIARISSGGPDATQFYQLTGNFSAVPEPAHWAALVGLACFGYWRQRRRSPKRRSTC